MQRGFLVLGALVLASAGVVSVALWRTDASSPEGLEGIPTVDPGPIHVHGLGINPADGGLFVAAHTGLYRAPRGERTAKRVAERFQDTMGFTIAGPDHFLGSGHPDPREAQALGLPPLLGLIESNDAGKTWQPVSRGGRTDFHVLRAGRKVYGYDSSNDVLLGSDDEGRTWEERQSPGRTSILSSPPSGRTGCS